MVIKAKIRERVERSGSTGTLADSFTTVRLDSVVIEVDDFTSICLNDTISLEARIIFSRVFSS